MQTIPEKATEEPNQESFDKGLVEWRWRFLELDNENRKIEISKCVKGNKREYLNKEGVWVVRDVHSGYDDYVTEQYFYYSDG